MEHCGIWLNDLLTAAKDNASPDIAQRAATENVAALSL